MQRKSNFTRDNDLDIAGTVFPQDSNIFSFFRARGGIKVVLRYHELQIRDGGVKRGDAVGKGGLHAVDGLLEGEAFVAVHIG